VPPLAISVPRASRIPYPARRLGGSCCAHAGSMRTDRFSAPCPPDVLLVAYGVEPDVGRATGLTAAHRVTDLTVLDGYLLVAGDGSAQVCAGGRASGELLIIDPTAVRGAAVGGTAVPASPQRISLRSRPAAVTAVVTDVGRRVFVLADGGGEIVPIDLRRDAHLVRPGGRSSWSRQRRPAADPGLAPEVSAPRRRWLRTAAWGGSTSANRMRGGSR